ncbi:MAG: site-2 protease family protein [Candidatus Paceibacterota bacterium]
MDFGIQTIFTFLVLYFSVVIHELAHAYVAYSMGDNTARNMGRLTINPLAHIDLFGTILLPLSMILANIRPVFGFAKPVPINPYKFNDQNWGLFKVALAGPLSNLSLALIFGLVLRFLPINSPYAANFAAMINLIVIINIGLFSFNILPIPPLDGSDIFGQWLPFLRRVKHTMNFYMQFVLLWFVLYVAGDYVYYFAMFLYKLITGISF